MKPTIARLAMAVLALGTLVSGASAEPLAFDIDRAHTSVIFQVRHFFTKVPGRFTDFSGALLYDPKDIAKSSVEVTIQATSINTANDRRDNHLRSTDFFEVEKFPTLAFKSTKVVPGEGNAFKIEGDLTIRGVTKPVVLDAINLGMGDVPGRENEMRTLAGFEAATTINRKDFGIVWNRMLDQGGAMLGDDVEIKLAVEASHTKVEAAEADAKK